MKPWLSVGGALLCAAWLASCNEDNKPIVSLEQAKQITTAMRGTGFTPPPRTIDDITAVLDQFKPDPAKAEANRKTADANPPKGASSRVLVNFYFGRALAAAELGRTSQEEADLLKARDLARQSGANRNRVAQALYRIELNIGNAAAALDATKEWEETAKGFGERLGILTGRAAIYARLGDLAQAHAYIQQAYARLGADSAATVVNPVGLDATTANAYQESYLHQLLSAQAVVEETEGKLAQAEDTQRRALSYGEQSLSKYEVELRYAATPFPRSFRESTVDNARLALGHVLWKEGKLLEAEAQIRETLVSRLRRRGRYAPETADAIVDLAEVIAAGGRPADAERLGQAAVDIYEKIGAGAGSWPLANARNTVAATQAEQGKWNDAAATLRKLDAVLGDDPAGRARYVDSNLTLALVDIHVHRAAEAVPILRRIADSRGKTIGETAPQTTETRGLLGVALAASGDQAAALHEFEAAVPAIVAANGDENRERQSAEELQRRRLILDAYIGLLADRRGSAAFSAADVAAATFQLADAARGGTVQKAVAESSVRAAAKDAALADLVRRGQDAERQRTALQTLLANVLASPADPQDQAAIQRLRRQIDELHAAQVAIGREIARRFPEYAQLTDPAPASVEQVQKSLHPGEALIATYVGEERTFVWAVPKTGPVAFAAVPLGHAQLKAVVKTLRKALDPAAATLDDVPAYDVKTAYQLYEALLKPVEAGWTAAKTLLVVAQGPLGPLPFDVLVTEPYQVPAVKPGEALFSNYKDIPWLARKVAIAWLPSVTALTSLRNVPAPPSDRLAFAGFGDPWFNQREAEQGRRDDAVMVASAAAPMTARGLPLVRRSIPGNSLPASYVLSQLPRLPDTATEVKSIGAALGADPERDIFLGARASAHRAETMDLSSRKVVLFATHGLMAGELNGLTEPALAMTSPVISGDGGNGLLSLSDIMALRLNADWVVLSACNTAAGDGAGAEAVSGLGRGFFYAGARALLVTHWPVETTSAEMETVDLFRRQAANPKLSRAEALQQAKLAVIKAGYVDKTTGRMSFSYAHPMFWAPYALVGDPG